jgi:hypothetical protein
MDPQQETAMIVSGGGFGDIWKGSLHNGGKVAIKAWRTNTLGQCNYKTLKVCPWVHLLSILNLYGNEFSELHASCTTGQEWSIPTSTDCKV